MIHFRKGLLTLALIFVVTITFAQSFTGYSNNPAGNDGLTEVKSINIYTAGDLIYLSKTPTDWGKYFVLMTNIDFGSKELVDWDNNGSATWNTEDQKGFSPIGNSTTKFTGTFKSINGNIISNLYINRTTDYNGLFGFVGIGARISKIGIENARVTGTYYNGTLAGQIYASETKMAYISQCYSAGGSVTGNNGTNTGGLIGSITETQLTNSYACVSVSGYSNYIAGLVGYNSFRGFITNCYAAGLVQGYYYYSKGGLTGENYQATVSNSYWDIETSKQITSFDGTGLTTTDFSKSSNFSGWDFTNTWQIAATNEDPFLRPRLKWQILEDCVVPYNVKVENFTDGNLKFSWTDIGYATEKWAVEYGTVGFELGKGTRDTVDINSYTINGLNIGESIDLYVKSICSGNNNCSGWAAPCSIVLLPSGGYGTLKNPYKIGTIQDLDILSKQPSIWNAHFILINDIDALETKTSTAYNNGGLGFSPIGNSTKKFVGTFNGKGHVISNLYIKRNQQNVGLFGYVGSGVRVDSLGLENINISNQGIYTGALIGFVAITEPNSIFAENCYVAGGTVEGYFDIGGLVGKIDDYGIIKNCYSSVTIKCPMIVSNGASSGGFIGNNEGGNIINCYAGGRVDAIDGNGLARYSGNTNSITSSYWDKDVSGKTNGWGEYSKEIAGVEFGLTTAEFANKTKFSGWNFTNVWQIGAIKFDTYQRPRLKWQGDRIGLISRYRVSPSNSGTILGDTLQVTNANILPSEARAIPNSGYHFIKWQSQHGDSITNINPLLVNVTRDTMLIAIFGSNTYEIVFDPNTGSGTMPNQIIKFNATANLNTNLFTKTGYSFAGWATTPSGAVGYTNGANYTMQTAGIVTLYAKWTINSYSVTFNSQGGSSVASVNANYNTKITVPTAPTLTGYTFGGWFKEAVCTNLWNFASDVVTANTTLYAKWNINIYTVTFNAQGGSAVASVNANHNTTISAPTAPTRTGYTFRGWYKEAACTNAWVFASNAVTSNTTLYAKWTINVYIVTFNSQGGSAVTNINANYNTTITAPIAPTRTGYTFDGWYKEIACANVWNFTTDVVTANTTLFAKWNINSYTVTFNSQGGSNVASVNANYNTTITAPTAPTRTGYTFSGWYKETACTNAWNFTSDVVTANTMLYAKWNINVYTVTFDSQGGSNIASVSATYSTTIANPTFPTRTGYTFHGWYKEPSCINPWSFNTDLVKSDITLYALWAINFYTVTFNSQGGSSVDNVITSYNSIITTPSAPTRTGYTFNGWYKEAGCINPWTFATDVVTSDITLYAKWTFNTYTVIFNTQGGSSISNVTANYNSTITIPSAPTKTGYTFDGWYKEVGCINPWTFATDVVTSDITLYAKWNLSSDIETISGNNFKLYPNPAVSNLTIEGENIEEITIYSLIGAKVLQPAITSKEAKCSFSIDELESGIYFARIKTSGNKIATIKFIKR